MEYTEDKKVSYQWLSARLQYLQCGSNGDTAVLHWAIDMKMFTSQQMHPHQWPQETTGHSCLSHHLVLSIIKLVYGIHCVSLPGLAYSNRNVWLLGYMVIVCLVPVWASPAVDFINTLRPWQMDAISQTPFSNAFSWMKMFEFRLKVHWSLFPRVQLTIFQQWFR